jgi:hypothetical protein
LISAQKAVSLEVAKMMAYQLAISANAKFRRLLAGDESWIAYDSTPWHIRTMGRVTSPPIRRPISHRREMMTIFFSVHSIALIYILPKQPSSAQSTSRRTLSKNVV